MEVRVLSTERARASGSQGQRERVRAAAAIKGCNDVAVDGFGQACRFLASFGLPFALHGYANEETAHEAPRPACFRRSLDGTSMANPKYGLIRAR
jgi:hypothetical protein